MKKHITIAIAALVGLSHTSCTENKSSPFPITTMRTTAFDGTLRLSLMCTENPQIVGIIVEHIQTTI